jgi:hypothetical protein
LGVKIPEGARAKQAQGKRQCLILCFHTVLVFDLRFVEADQGCI